MELGEQRTILILKGYVLGWQYNSVVKWLSGMYKALCLNPVP
jgi:hypothetical protein